MKGKLADEDATIIPIPLLWDTLLPGVHAPVLVDSFLLEPEVLLA